MGPRSLSTRLLASVSILLVLFFGITIAALDFAFRRVTVRLWDGKDMAVVIDDRVAAPKQP